MYALIMAGGKGSRMISENEKPMIPIKGKPMIDYVFSALRDSGCFTKIIVAVSRNTPKTALFMANAGAQVANSSGQDYVKDLNAILSTLKPNSVLVISVDLPLIDTKTIRELVDRFRVSTKPCLSVMVSREFLDKIGMKNDYCIETQGRSICSSGISIIDSSKVSGYSILDEEFFLLDKVELAVNVNRKEDIMLAEKYMNVQ